ncbi:MAG: hypothetical protein V4580_17420 [Bacteroidota bacterium]
METTYALSENKTLKIFLDQNPDTPRSWDNMAKMIFFGKHKHLGDNHEFRADDYSGWDEMEKAICRKYNVAIIKKVYAYSHSGMTIALTPFSCKWDSGILGFAVVTKEAIRENFMVKRVTKELIEKATLVLEGEVETLDQYITGDIYGFKVEDANGEEVDSCWGFFGADLKENGILDHIDEVDKALVLEKL